MLPELARRYADTGKVKFVWHDFAWIGEESRLAAQAARCAGRQGEFWEFHDHLYNNQRGDNQGHFSAANLRTFAGVLALDVASFSLCLEQRQDLLAIQQELTAAREMGVTATPTFFINAQRVTGPRSVDVFAEVIEVELVKAGR